MGQEHITPVPFFRGACTLTTIYLRIIGWPLSEVHPGTPAGVPSTHAASQQTEYGISLRWP